MQIEQVLYQGSPRREVVARSLGVADDWLPTIEQLCDQFGTIPVDSSCPLALFARPFGARRVAVVRVTDSLDSSLRFHLLILPFQAYLDLSADPFLLAERYPVEWQASGTLPTLEWNDGPPPRRTVDQIRRVLDVVAERTQMLLGGAQALMDGGRLAIVRKAPDPELLRDFWMLLPTEARSEIWPATFHCGDPRGFHLVVVPDDENERFEHYVRESDAGDYPEGRYEFALQQAAESSDQASLDLLFARRSRSRVLRQAIILLLVFLLIPALVVLSPGCPPALQPPVPRQPNE